MNEKDTALMSDDYGRDLASVQALQRKHEGLERDLAALEDKVCMHACENLIHQSDLLFLSCRSQFWGRRQGYCRPSTQTVQTR